VRIITRGVIDWETLEVLETDSFEYDGPVALCKDSGSAPAPVDPYEQAGAQYALSTGAAQYGSGLSHIDTVNPLGSTTWGTSSPQMMTGGQGMPAYTAGVTPTQPYSLGGSGVPMTNPSPNTAGGIPGTNSDPYASMLQSQLQQQPPQYTQETQLAPQFESLLQQPIDTSGIPGMPGGPNVQQTVDQGENAAYAQQMGYLAPEQALQSEGLNSQLAAEGAAPGSAAYNNAQMLLGQQQTFGQQQAAASAIGEGMQIAPMMYGLGSTSLQNQEGLRNNYINDFMSLNGAGGGGQQVQTPDISGAFGQQYQGALNSYNAGVATNNANTQAGAGLASSALMYLALA
jgi:hypothetical protein